MCGLIYAKRFDREDVREQALALYSLQKDRGQQGFGFISLAAGDLEHYARAEEEVSIKKELGDCPCDELLFHHRMPTSTPNFAEAAHPIRVSNEKLKHDYYVIHNGIIFDDEGFKAIHEKEGYKYTTEMVGGWFVGGKIRGEKIKWNDSEALAIELAIDLDQNGDGVDVSGSIAFICLQVDKITNKAIKLFWGRNAAQPLKFLEVNNSMAITSEGMGDIVRIHTLYSYDYATAKIEDKKYQVGWVYNSKPFSTFGKQADEKDDEDEYVNITSKEAKEITIGDDGMLEMPDEYFVLQGDRERLEKEINRGYSENSDDVAELEAELDQVEERIDEMEKEYDMNAITNISKE